MIDKKRTGSVSIQNFLRILQVCGLKVDNKLLVGHTDESKNTVDYAGITNILME